jgi:hypothetical protein
MSLLSLITQPTAKPFRRLYMKRRVAGGEYEATWQEIENKYVKSWGSVKYAIDDIMPDFYKFDGFDFSVVNYDGYFGPITDDKSFFYGAITKYNTLVRVDAGLLDSTSTEYPTVSTLFIGLLDWDVVYKEDPVISFKTKHLSSIFDDIPADRISGLNVTLTASQVIAKVRDYTDISGTAFFQKFITAGAWTIQTTTNNYLLATNTSLQDMSCWELMVKLANAEQYTVRVDKAGAFYFQEKTAIATTVSFHFSGLGDSDHTWGHSILKDGIEVDENIRKVYNRVRIKHDEPDTITSYYIYNETWSWGDSSSSFMYGVKEYEYENMFLDTATSVTIGNNIFTEFRYPKQEVKLKNKFLPQLELNDRTSVTYQKQRYIGGYLWGHFFYGNAVWGKRLGYNIFLDNTNGRLTEIEHDIDNFSTNVTMRGI